MPLCQLKYFHINNVYVPSCENSFVDKNGFEEEATGTHAQYIELVLFDLNGSMI